MLKSYAEGVKKLLGWKRKKKKRKIFGIKRERGREREGGRREGERRQGREGGGGEGERESANGTELGRGGRQPLSAGGRLN